MRRRPRPGAPIALVTSSPAPYHPRHYHLMARALHDAGLPVVVVSQPPRAPHPPGPVPVIALPRTTGRLTRMLSGPRVLRRLMRLRPAVVQIDCLDLLPWAVVARALLRVPVVYDSNEDYAAYMLLKEWVPARVRPALARAVAVLEPALAARLDAVTTADEGTARRFRGRARRVCVVHNFPRRDLGGPPGPDGEATFDITYHGTLHSYYRDHIVEAARRLARDGAPARWCLAVRDAGPSVAADLEAHLEAAGVREHFTLRYDLPFEEIPAILRRTRVGFIPLPDEPKYHVNLPRKLFEFMALGIPAVTSDLAPIRALVGGAGCCELVTPGDDDAYAGALAGVLADPARAAAMGRRGRRLVDERLNAEAAVGPYVALLRELAGRGR